MKTTFQTFLLACVLFLGIPSCTLFQSKDDVLYDKALERKKFIEPLQGNYKLIAYEKNGTSILDSFAIYKPTELTYNFNIQWSTGTYESYTGFIQSNILYDSVNVYVANGSWSSYNMDTHKVDFAVNIGTTDTTTKINKTIHLCKMDYWELISHNKELDFKLVNGDTIYLIKFAKL